MSKKIECVTGQILGKCVFLQEVEKNKNGDRMALFKCACGNEFQATIWEVNTDRTNSCGCGIHRHAKLRKELNHAYKSEYVAWCSIKYRCYNPSCKDYRHYGGRGIKMCDRWVNSFDAFLEDMGPKPTPKHTVERLRVNEDYEPSNCVWLINVEQTWNMRTSRMLTHNGVTKSAPAWAKELGIPYKTVKARIDRGLPTERVLCKFRYDSHGVVTTALA
jgi:hypothetical protein